MQFVNDTYSCQNFICKVVSGVNWLNFAFFYKELVAEIYNWTDKIWHAFLRI